MDIQKEFRTLLLPIIKGLPFIVVVCVVAFVIARRAVLYAVPKYQAEGSIKIDTKDFSSDFDLFGTGSGTLKNYMTEVEIVKSKNVKERAVNSLPELGLSIYRKGKIKTVELYKERPFDIDYMVHDEAVYDAVHQLLYLGNGQFKIISPVLTTLDEVEAERAYKTDLLDFGIMIRRGFLAKKPQALAVGDQFTFVIHSKEALITDANANNLFIKPMDKEIYIVKVYYQHEIPEKAALFTNALMNAYIENDLANKNRQAVSTVDFIDDELEKVREELKAAEQALANYKTDNEITDPKLEIDAILKELASLDQQVMTYDLQEIELTNVYNFLQTDQEIGDFSPNYEILKDAVIKENFQKLKGYETDKKDLLQKFTPTSAEVLNIQDKITTLKRFLLKSIQRKLSNLRDQKAKIEGNLNASQKNYETLPEREKQLIILERELSMAEQTFLFLTKKKTEVTVANSANYSFHEIIDLAKVPKKPISPNKGLMYGLAIFLALMFSLVVIYIWSYLFSTVANKTDVTERVKTPLIATVARIPKRDKNNLEPFINLYTNLNLLLADTPEASKVITVSSTAPQEGKSFVISQLAKVLANYKKEVLVVDMNVHNPELHKHFGVNNLQGMVALLKEEVSASEAILKTNHEHLDLLPAGVQAYISSDLIFSPKSTQLIAELKQYYDVILIDTPAVGRVVDAVPLMHQSDLNLYLVRAKSTKKRRLGYIDRFIQEYQVPTVHIVLNGLKTKASQYSKRRGWFG